MIMLRRLFKSFTYNRAIRREMQRLRNRLLDLQRWSPGRQYVWHDGAIREYWRHPTKGWRSRRVEPFAMHVSGKSLGGTLNLDDVLNPAKVTINHG
jgi:hypothetical protein